ncbi:LANO_0F06722g1_1 [Lachancea nothofagi CBS 11611]|uniref:LANO_0F06722g1_1 n=1 Tax=Lachancea nothofagi CBS 11611 TaxID=1266666 RepID=A0A1G4K8Q0_9SACH|nr:LANO_0F06722g1_1 [Lachancea nothofagi CBS 11611]
MVKKKQNPLRIDYHRGIIEGSLLHITNHAGLDEPRLVKIWTVDIQARDSQRYIEFVRRFCQNDEPVSFLHIKRIRKSEERGALTVIICSKHMIEEEDVFLMLMEQAPFEYTAISGEFVVPSKGPSTKDLSLKWSSQYWPLVWRGNPNDQIMNDYVFDLPFIKEILDKISNLANSEEQNGESGPPVVSAFVNPKTRKVVYAADARFRDSPLDHSLMRGIRSVAALEHARKASPDSQEKEETYLCLNFDVYTTHEPCSMCAMALIHSRIKRCIFLQPMKKTGCLESESGDGYCMHNNYALNSKYEVFRWLGSEYPVPHVESEVCC